LIDATSLLATGQNHFAIEVTLQIETPAGSCAIVESTLKLLKIGNIATNIEIIIYSIH